MGLGQQMPDTARALARKLGLPYRPDLLSGTDRASRDYQEKLTDAAAREAWSYGRGDPRAAAHYYFAGPDRSGWGPKTRRYGQDILRRMGFR